MSILKSIARIIIRLLIIVIILILSTGCFYVCKNSYKINTDYKPNTDPQYVRIYYDIATWPTLYQVEDFLNQSPDSINFVTWRRIPNLKEKLKKYKNTYCLKYKTVGEVTTADIDSPELDTYIQKHPNAKYIIYVNNNHIKHIFPTLSKIPKESIVEINVYEDGTYAGLFAHRYLYREKLLTDYILRDYFKDTRKVFHISNADKLNSFWCILDRECVKNKNFYKNDIITKASIENIKQYINKNHKIKEKYFEIFDFDYKKYKKEMTHPYGIFFFSVVVKHEDYFDKPLNMMKELLYGKLNYLIKSKNVKWFYKEHPHLESYPLTGIMNDRFPEVKAIDKSIPFELFLIADIVPDYVAGYSSGVFLNIPKDNISAFIYREPDDRNLQVIKKYHLIRPGRCIFADDIDGKSFKNKYNHFMSKVLVWLFK